MLYMKVKSGLWKYQRRETWRFKSGTQEDVKNTQEMFGKILNEEKLKRVRKKRKSLTNFLQINLFPNFLHVEETD